MQHLGLIIFNGLDQKTIMLGPNLGGMIVRQVLGLDLEVVILFGDKIDDCQIDQIQNV